MTKNHSTSALAALAALVFGGCSSLPMANDVSAAPPLAHTAPAGTIHVHPGRASLVYTLLSFDKECHQTEPRISVELQPTKGEITFKPDTSGTVLSSPSGLCVGTRLLGTGILYTPRDKQFGTDTFSIMATTNSGAVGTRSFNVEIVE